MQAVWVDQHSTAKRAWQEVARLAEGAVARLPRLRTLLPRPLILPPPRLRTLPPEVAQLDDAIIEGLHRRGADPRMGRKLLGLMCQAGLKAEVGVHPGSWTGERLKAEANDEWETIAADSGLVVDDETLIRAKAAYVKALEDGSLCLFNPIFYAFGTK